MLKRIQFILGLYGLFFSLFDLNAANEPQTSLATEITCSAPPPSNFRITTRGTDFIDLAWDPAWLDAIHTITVSRNTGTGTVNNWIPIDTFHNISGSVFTINDVECGPAYRIKIATNCSKDVIGTETDSLDEKTVVDLIINGRMPKNPIVVDCHNIEFMNPTNEWVGFRVSYNIEGFVISNLFELEIIQTKALNNPDETNIIIKRVNNINPIVAGNLLKYWPTTNIPLIHSQNPFNMYHLFNYDNLDVIGDIRVERHLGSPITVDLCVANTFSPWNYNDYSFEALVAKDIIGSPQPFTINEDPLSDRDRITFTNPITNTLNIYLPNYSSNKGEDTKISIATLEGRVILNRQFHVSEGSISLPVDNFPQGFYLVHIKNKFETKVLKIFKY